MKLPLVVTLLLTLVFSSVTPAVTPQDSIGGLTNQDILTMVRAKLPSSLVIEKINTSTCAFDTFPSVLAELKYKGVPDDVLMAMVKAPRGSRAVPRVVATGSSPLSTSAASTQSPAAVGPEILLPEGTEFSVETVDEVSSKTASENDPVNFRVVDSVRVGDMVVIRAGTLVKGIIATVEQRGHLGKGGKLGMRVESTTIVDGQKVKLRASKGKGDTGTVGSTIVLSVLISPLFLLRRGNHAVIKPGTKIQVFTDEEKKVMVPAR